MQGCQVPEYLNNLFVISMEIPAPQDNAGGLIVADVKNNARKGLHPWCRSRYDTHQKTRVIYAIHGTTPMSNTSPHSNPNRARPWTGPMYRRVRTVGNYYSL